MLNDVSLTGNIAGLFYKGVDWRQQEDLHNCERVFMNLALHAIEGIEPGLLSFVRFDKGKTQIMLRRFYRDAFGAYHFRLNLGRICPDQTMREAIIAEMDRLSVRIGSPKPRITRIAAAFSLWMATFRPIYFIDRVPDDMKRHLWSIEAKVNFYISTTYLKQYGTIEIGLPGRDRRVRLQRILYDFTCRDLNLSSLELLYCSVFRPLEAYGDNELGEDDFMTP